MRRFTLRRVFAAPKAKKANAYVYAAKPRPEYVPISVAGRHALEDARRAGMELTSEMMMDLDMGQIRDYYREYTFYLDYSRVPLGAQFKTQHPAMMHHVFQKNTADAFRLDVGAFQPRRAVGLDEPMNYRDLRMEIYELRPGVEVLVTGSIASEAYGLNRAVRMRPW